MYLLQNRPPLRKDMMDGDFFIGAALATSLTKLALKFISITSDKKRQNVSNYGKDTFSKYHRIISVIVCHVIDITCVFF